MHVSVSFSSRHGRHLRRLSSFSCAALVAVACGTPQQISLLDEGAATGAGGAVSSNAGAGGGSPSGSGGAPAARDSGSDPRGGWHGGGSAPFADAAPPCVRDADCASPAPYCDAQSGACVECLIDRNCSSNLCDVTAHACGRCAKDLDCHAGTSHCDADDHRCVECMSSSQCAVGEVCAAEAHACRVSCQQSSDCVGDNRPICAPSTGVCVECTSDVYCIHGLPLCDLLIGSCVECLVDTDCQQGRCTPLEHRCVECLTSADCNSGRRCSGFSCEH